MSWIFLCVLVLACVWMYRSATRDRRKLHSVDTFLAKAASHDLPAVNEPPTLATERDAWEGSFWDASYARTLRKDVLLEYVDGKGDRTRRRVAMRQFDDGIDMFIGHCSLRNATRTFRFSRIISCANAETGEVIPDFKAYCISEYEKTENHSLDRLLQEHFDAMSVALYFGKIDGRLTKKENAHIAVFAASVVNDKRLNAESLKSLFNGWSTPTIHSFRLAVGRLKSKPLNYRHKLIDMCEAMMATETKESPGERETVDYLRKRLLG